MSTQITVRRSEMTLPGHRMDFLQKAAASIADGVIVGSAVVRKLLDGDLEGAAALAHEIRSALDA